jgi:hypothetical protein
MLLWFQRLDVMCFTPCQDFGIQVDASRVVARAPPDPFARGISSATEIFAQVARLALAQDLKLFVDKIDFGFDALHRRFVEHVAVRFVGLRALGRRFRAFAFAFCHINRVVLLDLRRCGKARNVKHWCGTLHIS